MNIYEKLTAIQCELKAPKSQRNSLGNYNYRNCEDILEALKPLTAKHKCSCFISNEVLNIGDRFYIQATAILVDCESGERITATAQAREEECKNGMDGSQVSGAASSYARKYALAGLFDCDDTKDADSSKPRTAREDAEAMHLNLVKVAEYFHTTADELTDEQIHKAISMKKK